MSEVIEKYRYDILRSMVGEQVNIRDSRGNSVRLTISEVIPGKLNGGSWEAFSVIYSGGRNFLIPQGTYTFEHPAFGIKKLFLSPNNDVEYETVITRAVDGSAGECVRNI